MTSENLPGFSDAQRVYEIPFVDYGILLYHPVTTEQDILLQATEILTDALLQTNFNFIVLYPNNDPGTDVILSVYKKKLSTKKNFLIYPSIRFEFFVTLMKYARFLIGNSSAGIREAPYFGVPSINVGSRQQNRLKSGVTESIIHCGYEREALVAAMMPFMLTGKRFSSVLNFGGGRSSSEFLAVLNTPWYGRPPFKKYSLISMSTLPRYKNSVAHYRNAKALLPNQTQTLSKGPGQFVVGEMPLFNQRAKGCFVWDVDGNKFIDFIGARWPIILGYAHPVSDNAIKRQLKDGIIFPQPHPLEAEVAALLTKVIPSAEMVRFAKNGSDATGAAVRIARAYTGKEIIIQCGYHGAQDWFIVSTERNLGVPKVLRDYIFSFSYNDIESLENLFRDHHGRVAAVIMEPMYDQFP